MPKPRLPDRRDAWEGGYLFSPARPMRSVDARRGMVIAGGEVLCMLRPGEQGMKWRDPPEQVGRVRLVAAEPRGQRRYAVASDTSFSVFFRGKEEDQIVTLTPGDAETQVTHLAWGGAPGACALYARHDDGVVARMKPDLSDIETIDVDPMDALASDDDGAIAMVCLTGGPPRAYVTTDGAAMSYRAVGVKVDPECEVELAVAGTAVALALDDDLVLVSRSPDAQFERCEPLCAPEDGSWTAGPIAFEGPASGAALFGVQHAEDMTRIVRVDPSGAVLCIAELGTEGADPPEILSLTWDSQRRTLWGASPAAGLFKSEAPGTKRGQKVLLS